MSATVRTPCTFCPWRVGVDAWAIGRENSPEIPPLSRLQMEEVAHDHRMQFAKVMACHLTHKGEAEIDPQNRICAGYALSREAGDNLNLRLLALNRKVDLLAFTCAEPLHPDFAAMLAANPPRKETP